MTEVKVSIDRATAGTSHRRDASRDCQPLAIAKPLFMCMTLVGIQTATYERSGGHKFSWLSICGVIWCTFTALLVWLNVARLIPMHLDKDFADGFDEKTFIRIIVFVWYLQCAINVAVCLRASIKNNLLHRMYTLWTKYCRKRSFQRHAKSLRRVVWMLTVCFVLFCITNLVIMSFILYKESEVTEEFAKVLYSPVGKSEGMKLFLVFYQSFIAGTWILPLWLFLVICFINTQLLEDARTSIIDETDNKTKKFLGRIEQIRMLHEEACVMVVCADDTFSVFVALGLATDIPMGCFEMYMLIWPTTDSKFIQLFNVFLLFMFVFHLAIIMWSASRVHTEVTTQTITSLTTYLFGSEHVTTN
jgi:hypothetical protein